MHVQDAFTWSGQPVADWPRWLIFKNYAADADKILIHTLWAVIEVRRGQTLELLATQEVRLAAK